MKKIAACVIIFSMSLITSCKKQVCFKCRDVDFASVCIKGNDTVYILGNASSAVIQNLIDSGYSLPYHVGLWQNNYVMICNDEGVKKSPRDSCERQ